MSAGDDGADRSFEPTQRKLDEARRRGEVPKSLDLLAAAAYAGLAAAMLALGGPSLVSLGAVLQGMLASATAIGVRADGAPDWPGLTRGLIALVPGLTPTALAPALAVVIALIAQRAIVFAPEKLSPRLDRLSPLANARQKFGPGGLVEFAKSAAKLVVVCTVLFAFLLDRLPEILGAAALPAQAGIAMMLGLCLEFLGIVVLIAAVFGAADLLWQRADFRRRNMMTRQEVMDEFKETEGDPHLKQQRRQRGQEIATNRMLADVPSADVVIVNPTHYAVALKWSRARGAAPVCVAKGVDEIAARIRETAQAAGVPIHSDPPTARALHAIVDIGAEIRPQHYRAVAAAIRFADRMREKARRR